jgi:predicted molibdopterin-dependent oxidoreductase YjgC
MVLELLGSSVDLSLTTEVSDWMAEYGADPSATGEAGPVRTIATPARRATTRRSTGPPRQQPVKVDNDLYVRDYARCILCYRCVEACGEDAQNTFAIAVAGRGFDARISTEHDVP